MDWIHDALAQVGAWTSEDVSKGAAVAGVVGSAVLATALGWLRRRKEIPERVHVMVDAPKGQRIKIEVGEEGEQDSC